MVQTKKELEESRSEASKLSNPINTNNLDIQNRLELLDALEAGGVDNWEFYEIENGLMLNCYPEHIIFQDQLLLETIKGLVLINK